MAHHLAVHPELEQRLRQPDWARTDLDEFLRHDSVVTAMARKVTGPTELNGVALGAEDRITRVTNLRIAPGAQIALSPGVTRMPESLPLEFDRLS